MEEGEKWLESEKSPSCEEDFTQLCRICANSSDYLIPIFQGEGLEHELKSKIDKHLPIKVMESDRLPNNTCYQCASTLIAWHDLVVSCLEAEGKLRALLSDDQAAHDDAEEIKNPVLSKQSHEVNMSSKRNDVETNKVLQGSDTIIGTEDNVANQQIDLMLVPEMVAAEEIASLKSEIIEMSSDPRCMNMEEHCNDVNICIGGNRKVDIELEDDFESDFESDEEFNTSYSCSICKAANMDIEQFIKHSKNHTRHERQQVLEKLLDSKLKEEVAVRNAAAAYGFKLQQSLESSVSLYQCTVCGQGNLLLKNLQEHSTLHPYYSDSHFCNLCQNQFKTASSLSTHLETHLDCNDLFCQFCNRRFGIIEDLEEHESTHCQAEYVCVVCCAKFKTKEHILIHLKESHSTNNFCHVCDLKFKSEVLIDKHFVTHATVNLLKRIIKCFVCEFCEKRYESKISLQRHILFLHNNRMPYICQHCGFTAYHEDALTEHLDKDHFSSFKVDNADHLSHEYSDIEQNDTKEILSQTEGSRVSVESINIFEKEETSGEKTVTNIPCNLCEKSFASEIHLNVHLNKIHTNKFCKPDLNKGILPFKCNNCGAFFKLEFEFEEHIKRHKTILYQCHLCFLEFVTDLELQQHLIKVHEEELWETLDVIESSSNDSEPMES